MEEIVRRIKRESRNSLKESLTSKVLNEVGEEEEDEILDDPVDEEGDESSFEEDPTEDEMPADDLDPGMPPSPRGSSRSPVGDFEGDSETISPEDVEEFRDDEEEVNINPLDNQFAVNFKIGDEVSMTYSNGTASKLSGVIEGYDPEGFYRVKWVNGLTTNGITDIALSEFVSSPDTEEEDSCICGGEDFVTEGEYIVCDSCGRKIKECSELKEGKAYNIRYTYPGDELSDYEANVIVSAESPRDALRIAKENIEDGWFFKIEGTYDSVADFKAKFPKSNLRVIEGSDILNPSNMSKKRTKGSRLVRSELHPMSTSVKPSIGERIKNAFKGVLLKESEEDYDEDVYSRLKDKLSGVFWSRFDEMIDDIEKLGYEVVEKNMEYLVVEYLDDEDDDDIPVLKIPVVGTSRTMTLDFDKATEL